MRSFCETFDTVVLEDDSAAFWSDWVRLDTFDDESCSMISFRPIPGVIEVGVAHVLLDLELAGYDIGVVDTAMDLGVAGSPRLTSRT